MRILGIDPGTGRTGYGVVDVTPPKTPFVKSDPKLPYFLLDETHKMLDAKLVTFGCIETPKEDMMALRLVAIRKAIKGLLAEYKPQAVAIELLFHGPNAKTVMSVGQARGVVLEAVAGEGVPTFDYQGLMVKRVISGSGKADKKAMQELIRDFFHLEIVPKPDDAADGLAIALCHALTIIEDMEKAK